ncbi:MAG: permease, partial [Phototrophicaceae bacterium]
LSVCSTVDAFLALAFTGTFTVGSISAFLTFGPMIDVKSTLMFLGVFRRRAVAYLILIPFLLTLLAGVWLNLLLR